MWHLTLVYSVLLPVENTSCVSNIRVKVCAHQATVYEKQNLIEKHDTCSQSHGANFHWLDLFIQCDQ